MKDVIYEPPRDKGHGVFENYNPPTYKELQEIIDPLSVGLIGLAAASGAVTSSLGQQKHTSRDKRLWGMYATTLGSGLAMALTTGAITLGGAALSYAAVVGLGILPTMAVVWHFVHKRALKERANEKVSSHTLQPQMTYLLQSLDKERIIEVRGTPSANTVFKYDDHLYNLKVTPEVTYEIYSDNRKIISSGSLAGYTFKRLGLKLSADIAYVVKKVEDATK